MPVYVLDSNFFIEAHRASYPLDVAFSFWNKVKQLADERKIESVDKVMEEIYDKNDDLKRWCETNLPPDFFKDTSQVMNAYQQVILWAVSRSSWYLPQALNEFLNADEADAFIVGYCVADPKNRIVVTQEKSEPARKNKIKIPDACLALNVSSFNTVDMFRQLGETF
jgi:hypothetical protein